MRRDLLLTIKNALGESLTEDGWKTNKKGGRTERKIEWREGRQERHKETR